MARKEYFKSLILKVKKKKNLLPINHNDWIRTKGSAKMKLDIPQNKKIYLFISEKIDNPVKGLKVIKKILNKKKTNDFCLLF